jgi:predicted Rossmann fold nucleotide-binding protein DprA/Smf involved in DNA uptake
MKTGTLSQEQSEYPATLTQWLDKDAPVQLSYIGNIEILKQPLLGLFSSVKCPASLILKAHDLAQKLAEAGTPVIGGFHSPVEKEMLSVLLHGKGPLVFCLARGLKGMRISLDLRQVLEDGRLLIISSFADGIRRSEKEQAMRRNLLVAALADQITIIHLTPGGGIDNLLKHVYDWGKPITHIRKE